jgi:hypothetical protein
MAATDKTAEVEKKGDEKAEETKKEVEKPEEVKSLTVEDGQSISSSWYVAPADTSRNTPEYHSDRSSGIYHRATFHCPSLADSDYITEKVDKVGYEVGAQPGFPKRMLVSP